MTINKDYNSSDEEEWDMVPDSGEETPPRLTEGDAGAEVRPSTTTTTETEENAGAPVPLSITASSEKTTVEPSAPMEDEVMGLEAQQAKWGITDETSPEEIQRLLDEATNDSSVTNEDDTPLLEHHSPDNSTAADSNPKLPGWLRSSLGVATKVLEDVEQKHNIKQKTRHGLDTVGSSLRQVGTVVEHESRRLSQTVQQKADELDVKGKARSAKETIQQSAKTVAEGVHHKVEALDVPGKKVATETISRSAKTVAEGAKTAGETISNGAKTAGEKAKELNKDGKVTQFVAAAAVVGASIFLASKGKPGAGAAVMATGGAAFMAAEAANSGRRYDQGLNEDLHMD
jgi:uncharacterized protein YoxC